ncbi:FAD-dependent oxidoreductase [Acrocarpospora pleiomorpha]|uniref:FAD-dependent oxidoreductase n=1 Tax=Acrocarpospora pleiomorpha TaxID=90975 RepID=A0A5M3XWX9_9ACTN|nr:FAD-dependent oxidoreductase [Acrocarpospora pleiomorpha]GES25684.1 FAD-dependent oxidoreductase [Acrocarpospora pleiomorpha]
MTRQKYDVVVIGAGVLGASSAFHLAERGLRVAVVEARTGYAEGSTGLSLASVRAQWADPLNIELSWRSIQRWRDFEKTYGFDVGYLPNGYLLLFPEDTWARQLEAVETQRSFGVPVEVLTPEEAQAISSFESGGIAGATWCPTDGQLDPHGATGALLELAKRRAAKVIYRFPVDRIEAQPDGSWLVGAADRAVSGEYVVNTAGGWAGEVGALAGFELPVVPVRHNVYATAAGTVDKLVPLTIDCGRSLWVRSEGSRLLFGAPRPDEPGGFNTQLDWEWLEGVMTLAADRFPFLLDLPLDRSASWAGPYENTPDHDAILGPEPSAPTWINLCGLSGHGIMQAPELGRVVAEQVADGAITSYDATRLSVERFRDGGGRDTSGAESAPIVATPGRVTGIRT